MNFRDIAASWGAFSPDRSGEKAPQDAAMSLKFMIVDKNDHRNRSFQMSIQNPKISAGERSLCLTGSSLALLVDTTLKSQN